ncbi:MAG TPA: VOC family protein [Actinomycetaceae bacterium]|nr:VOC family protein [Actinomycetaceae bacterium]
MKLQFRGVTVEAGADQFDPTLAFYRAVFGDPKFVEDGAWAPFDAGGVSVNIAGPREAVGGGAVIQVKTDDLDAAVAFLEEQGGEVVQPPADGGHQRHAVLRDPSGTLLAVYSPTT